MPRSPSRRGSIVRHGAKRRRGERPDRVAVVLQALADPIRRRLLEDLAERGDRSATQLTGDFAITRQGVLKHLRLLAGAGLVATSIEGRERLFRLAPDPLNEVDRWIGALRRVWDQRLWRLKALVESDR